MHKHGQITRAAEAKSLEVFRKFIEYECRGYSGMDEGLIYDLKLAMDEACTNIITHGYAEMNPGSIMVELNLLPNQAAISITDFGHPFEPSEAPRPDVEASLDGQPTGGFGLFIIYQTMDKVHYSVDECGNHLVLTKYF